MEATPLIALRAEEEKTQTPVRWKAVLLAVCTAASVTLATAVRLPAGPSVSGSPYFDTRNRSSGVRPTLLGRHVFVSPHGDDSNHGQTADAPLRDLWTARDLARALNAGGNGSVTVHLASGTFTLSAALELGPLDSGVTWVGADDGSTLMSGGALLPRSCWVASSKSEGVFDCSLESAGFSAEAAKQRFRTLRVEEESLPEARWPESTAGRPWSTGWLYVEDAIWLQTNVWVIRVMGEEEGVLANAPWLTKSSWSGGRVKIFPEEGWNNYEANFRPATFTELTDSGVDDGAAEAELLLEGTTNYSWFVVECPDTADGDCDSDDSKLGQGSRFYVYSAVDALSRGEWFHDNTTGVLSLAPNADAADTVAIDAALSSVRVPQLTMLLRVAGNLGARGVPETTADTAHDITVQQISFCDADYMADGWQAGWNMLPGSAGVPSDAAVELSGTSDVTVYACTFKTLGGSGVHVANGTRRARVLSSTFEKLGQSGVLFTGNSTTQPTQCEVANNSITRLGNHLASAGGIVCSSCSDTRMIDNIIEHSPRWGILVRSQSSGGDADSINNLIARNRLFALGEQTKDFGGISLISYEGGPVSGTTIAHNCVRDVSGAYSGDDGTFYEGYMGHGVYLDNYASGYSVIGNVIRNSDKSHVFFHLGRDNIVENNIFVNATNTEGAGGQLEISGKTSNDDTRNNSFARNIVAFALTSTQSLWSDGDSGNFRTRFLPPESTTRNIYFPRGVEHGPFWFYATSSLTPLGGWADWRAEGYDNESLVADPLFVDEDAGNFCLSKDSPAFALGFESLPASVCNC